MLSYNMSLTFEEIDESKTKTKFYSKSENKIMTKSEIIKITKRDWAYDTPKECYLDLQLHHNLPCDLVELKKIKIIRDGKSHNFDCEFATGRSCNCWCGEKYHGMMGVKN